MKPILLAIDAGGTSTRCAALTQRALCVGFATVGASNPVSSGLAGAIASLSAAATGALRDEGIAPGDVTTVTVAMAGISTGAPVDLELETALRAFGINAPVHLESDAAAAFCSGTASRNGSVLISGTGAAAVRMDAGRSAATADGLGWLLGDVGSGFWIGRRIVRAALAHLDRRGPATTLTAMLLEELGLPSDDSLTAEDGRPHQVMRILTSVYTDVPVRLARFAPLAFVACERDQDAVAIAIVEAAAEGLHTTLRAVIGPSTDPVVASGGLLSHQPVLRRLIEDRLHADGLDVRMIPVRDGLPGAAVLALRHAGVEVDETVRERLHSGIDGRRGAPPTPGTPPGEAPERAESHGAR